MKDQLLAALPTATLYAIALLVLVGLLIHWHLSQKPEFRRFTVLDMVCDPPGQLNPERTAKTVALIVTTIGFVHLVLSDKLTEWYFSAYVAAWILADRFRGGGNDGRGRERPGDAGQGTAGGPPA